MNDELPSPILETPRLILRPPIQDDFDGFAAMAAEESTMRFLGGTTARHAAWRGMATIAGSWTLLGFSMFSVIEKASGRWLGRIGPWQPGGDDGGWPGREVGWGLLAGAQGKGYAFEGAVAVLDWVFDELEWNAVIHCIDRANVRSVRLAERLGSYRQRENVRLPAPFDALVDVYGQTRDEWLERRPRPTPG